MAKKITGLEFKKFWSDKAFWPDQTYTDDVVFKVNEKVMDENADIANANDMDLITIENGFVLESTMYKSCETPSLLSYFRKWQKTQTTSSFLVDCDNSLLEAVKAAVLAAGGKITS